MVVYTHEEFMKMIEEKKKPKEKVADAPKQVSHKTSKGGKKYAR